LGLDGEELTQISKNTLFLAGSDFRPPNLATSSGQGESGAGAHALQNLGLGVNPYYRHLLRFGGRAEMLSRRRPMAPDENGLE
jgi:hypothetical protein